MTFKNFVDNQITQEQANSFKTSESFDNIITEKIKEEFLNKEGKAKRIYAVMFFNSEMELGISANPNAWVNTKNYVTVDGSEALSVYANTPNPASQLIDAESLEELKEKMNGMINNFKDEKFLEELYEYL